MCIVDKQVQIRNFVVRRECCRKNNERKTRAKVNKQLLMKFYDLLTKQIILRCFFK